VAGGAGVNAEDVAEPGDGQDALDLPLRAGQQLRPR
jgi:hypothetical protein